MAYQVNNTRNQTVIVILAVLIGITNISLAKGAAQKRQTPSTSYGTGLNFGPIENPYDTRSYISDLADKLSPKQRDILLGEPDIYKSDAATSEYQKLLSRSSISVDSKRYKSLINKENELRHAAKTAEKHWSLAEDLEKYRVYSVREGSRTFIGSIRKAGFHAGLAIEDIVNVFTLASTERAEHLRENDGKPISFYLEKVGQAGAETLDNILITLYSSADLITLDLLPDFENEAYQDNHPLVRPFVFTGRSIGSAWQTVESVGNVPTFGYFDNVTGSICMLYIDAIETVKHGCEAVTNLPRGFIRLGGRNENLDRIQDWIFLVPLEYLSNVIEMEGISNAQDYKNAFKAKGVIGSILEIGGSSYIVYRAVDDMLEELDDDDNSKRPAEETSAEEAPAEETPAETATTTNGENGTSPNGFYHFPIDVFF